MNDSPSAILRKWFERVWNAGDESVIDELYGPSAVAHGQPATPIPGPEGFKPLFRTFRSAFPNLRIEVTHAVSEGDLGVVRSVRFTGMTMARVGGGRIHEGWNAYDFLSMYQQLGIEPPPV